MAWHCTPYYCGLHRYCLCRSFVTRVFISRTKNQRGRWLCWMSTSRKNSLMWSTHIYSSTYLFKYRQGHQLVHFFLERYIEAPFRININGKSAFSVSVPAPLWITWKFLAENFARNSEMIGGIISEHPRINQWIFQPFLRSICMVI